MAVNQWIESMYLLWTELIGKTYLLFYKKTGQIHTLFQNDSNGFEKLIRVQKEVFY